MAEQQNFQEALDNAANQVIAQEQDRKVQEAKDYVAQQDAQQEQQPETQEAAPEQPTAEQPAEKPEQQVQEPARTWKYRDGEEEVELTEGDVNFLLNLSVNALKQQHQAQAEPQQQPQAGGEEEVQLPPQLEQLLDKKLQPFQQYLQQEQVKTAQAQMQRETAAAMERQPFLKGLDDETKREAQGMVIALKASAPRMSYDTAAKRIAEGFERIAKAKQQNYVQGKVEQAANKVEGTGGAIPAKGSKPFSKEDLFNGRIEGAAMDQIMRSVAARAGK